MVDAAGGHRFDGGGGEHCPAGGLWDAAGD